MKETFSIELRPLNAFLFSVEIRLYACSKFQQVNSVSSILHFVHFWVWWERLSETEELGKEDKGAVGTEPDEMFWYWMVSLGSWPLPPFVSFYIILCISWHISDKIFRVLEGLLLRRPTWLWLLVYMMSLWLPVSATWLLKGWVIILLIRVSRLAGMLLVLPFSPNHWTYFNVVLHLVLLTIILTFHFPYLIQSEVVICCRILLFISLWRSWTSLRVLQPQKWRV